MVKRAMCSNLTSISVINVFKPNCLPVKRLFTTLHNKHTPSCVPRYCKSLVLSAYYRKGSVVKISPRQTFTESFNLCCDLDLKHSNPVFSLDTLPHDDLPLKPKSDCKRIRIQEAMVKTSFDYTSPHCDCDHSKPIFCMTLGS